MVVRELLVEKLHPILDKMQLEPKINMVAKVSIGPNAPEPVTLVTPQERKFAMFMMYESLTR